MIAIESLPFRLRRGSRTLRSFYRLRPVAGLCAALLVAVFQPSWASEAAALPKPADLPAQTSLPDPLVMLDGRKVTTREMWIKERRPELIRLFQHYMYGQLPPKPARFRQGGASGRGGLRRQGHVERGDVDVRPAKVPPIHLMLVVPNRRTTPAPVVLAMNYFGNHTLVHDQHVRLPDNWMPDGAVGR